MTRKAKVSGNAPSRRPAKSRARLSPEPMPITETIVWHRTAEEKPEADRVVLGTYAKGSGFCLDLPVAMDFKAPGESREWTCPPGKLSVMAPDFWAELPRGPEAER